MIQPWPQAPLLRRLLFVLGNLAAGLAIVLACVVPVSELFADRDREILQQRMLLARLQAVASRGGEVAIVVFDAVDEGGNPLWSFDPRLEDELRIELGRMLLKSQVALYRELIRMKATGLVGVGPSSRSSSRLLLAARRLADRSRIVYVRRVEEAVAQRQEPPHRTALGADVAWPGGHRLVR